jgi:hypothetical protein
VHCNSLRQLSCGIYARCEFVISTIGGVYVHCKFNEVVVSNDCELKRSFRYSSTLSTSRFNAVRERILLYGCRGTRTCCRVGCARIAPPRASSVSVVARERVLRLCSHL